MLTLGVSKVNIKGNFKGKVRKCHVPYLRLTPQLIRCLDFTPFEEGEGLGEKRGSLDKRHKERVRYVDQLVQEWERTVPGPAPGMAKDWGQLSKVPSKGGKYY